MRWAGKLNVPVYRLSGGRIGGKVGKAPVLLLTTTGRKSGQRRTSPVVYLADGANVILIDTNAGNERLPAWSLNLDANAECEVELGRERRTVRARRQPAYGEWPGVRLGSIPRGVSERDSLGN